MIVKYRSANDPEVLQFNTDKDTTGGLSEVKTELEFSALFEIRTNDRNFNWKTVENVQTCVKDQVGIGKHLMIHFFAPIDESSERSATKNEICYEYKHMDDEISLLQHE